MINLSRFKLRPLRHNQQGFLLPAVLTFMIAMGILSGAVLEVILNNFNVVGNNVSSQQAFNIAEAGVNYYLWHLSHNGTDFKDGQSTPATPTQYGYGPYTHEYIDSNSVDEGTFTLYISPQSSGSTIATIRSIGKPKGSNASRTIQAQVGAPSFASYGLVSDGPLWFGNNESADGPVHSNIGIRMDGPSDAEISSANATYTPPNSYGGDGRTHNGVWCNTVAAPGCDANTSDWVYPAPAVDFNQVSSSLCTMKKVAFADDPSTKSLAGLSNACTQTPNTRTAAYIPQRTTTSRSGTVTATYDIKQGYLIYLNGNNTYDLYKVTGEDDTQTTPASALSTSLIQKGIAIPASGVIFVEDNVWVMNSQTAGSTSKFQGRVTIASGKLASNDSPNIVISGPILYSTKNGSDAIGLVAENSVYVAPYAPSQTNGYSSGSFNFEIDAAVLAENGNVIYGENGDSNYQNTYRNSYQQSCTRGWVSPNQTMTFYGSVAVRQTWTWNWIDGRGSCGDAVYDPSADDGNGGKGTYVSGIEHTSTDYDYNLQYAPPPSYPVTGGYNILSWREVLTKP